MSDTYNNNTRKLRSEYIGIPHMHSNIVVAVVVIIQKVAPGVTAQACLVTY